MRKIASRSLNILNSELMNLPQIIAMSTIKRLKEKQVDAKDTVFYSAIISDIERVGDNLMNIIEEFRTFQLHLNRRTGLITKQLFKKSCFFNILFALHITKIYFS